MQTNTGMKTFSMEQIEQISLFTGRLLSVYQLASDDQIVRGRNWYSEANQLAVSMSEKTGISIEQAAYAIAVTSNNITWERQKKIAIPMVKYFQGGGDPWKFGNGVISKYSEKASRIILDNDISVLSGPKVVSFAQNIMGNIDVATIDRHALRACLGEFTDDETTSKWVRLGLKRNMIEAAYHQSASIVGESVMHFQAIIWITVKENKLYRRKNETIKEAKTIHSRIY